MYLGFFFIFIFQAFDFIAQFTRGLQYMDSSAAAIFGRRNK